MTEYIIGRFLAWTKLDKTAFPDVVFFQLHNTIVAKLFVIFCASGQPGKYFRHCKMTNGSVF